MGAIECVESGVCVSATLGSIGTIGTIERRDSGFQQSRNFAAVDAWDEYSDDERCARAVDCAKFTIGVPAVYRAGCWCAGVYFCPETALNRHQTVPKCTKMYQLGRWVIRLPML